MLNLGAYRPLP